MEGKDESKHTPDIYEIRSEGGSYVNIFRNGTAWLGSVEKTLALEICRKLNEHASAPALLEENTILQAEVDRLTKEKSDAETRMREEYTKRQIVEKENESLKLELEKQIEFLQALTRIK